MKLTYWIAECLDDSHVYNIRARTRREVVAALASYDVASYGPPKKVTFEYRDGFDLMNECLREGGGFWEE